MDVTLFAQLVLTGVVFGAPLAVLGLGLSLILNVAGRFHFAYSLTYTLGGFVAALLATRLGVPILVAVIVATCAAAVLGYLIEAFIYRPLARRSGDAALLPIFVSGLGLAIGGQSLIQFLWARESTSIPLDLVDISLIPLPFGLRMTTLDLLTLVVFSAIAFGAAAVLRYTRAGQVVRGVRVNRTMAQVVGINSERVFAVIFALASGATGLVATFSAARYSATPTMGYDPMFSAFVIAFLAGSRAPALRIVTIGFALGIVQSVSGLWIPSNLTNIVVFGILFVYLLARGTGFVGALRPATARS